MKKKCILFQIYCISLLIVFVSCNNSKLTEDVDEKMSSAEVINIDIQNWRQDDNLQCSKIVENVQYVPLETTADNIIGSIRRVICTDKFYYISDDISDAVFVFDTVGRFKFKVSAVGSGPGEYTRIRQFSVNEKNGSIVIHDDRGQKLVYYDATTGKYRYEVRTKMLFADFATINDTINCYYTAFSPNHYNADDKHQYAYVSTKNNNIDIKKIPYRYRDENVEPLPIVLNGGFFYSKDSVSFYGDNNIIYRIDPNGGLRPRYYIDFGNNTFAINYDWDYARIKKALSDYHSNRHCRLFRIVETPDVICIKYSLEDYICMAFVSKKTKSIYQVRAFWINDLHNLPLGMPDASQGKYFIATSSAFNFKQSFKRNAKKIPADLKMMDEKMNELDNPIIMKISMKAIF